MQRLPFIIIALLVNTFMLAQTSQTALPRNYDKREQVDESIIQIRYTYRQRRVEHVESYTEDVQILEIGEKYSKYYSRYAERLDSLRSVGDMSFFGRAVEPSYEDIFINYPKNGLMSVYTWFYSSSLVYQESTPTFDWTITNETDTVLNHLCYMATTNFRGRQYYAWFTTGIPMALGPWKFSGLPGLILKVEDTNKYFSYEAIAITQQPKPIFIYKDKPQKCTREDILRLNDLRWMDNDYLIKITTGKTNVTIGKNELNNAVLTKSSKTIVIPQKELE